MNTMQYQQESLPLPDAVLRDVIEECNSWAVAHGLVMGANQGSPDVIHAPLSLLPSPYPRELYHLAAELATDFGVLVHVASNNHDFILSSLER